MEPGIYFARVKEAVTTQSSKGTPQIVVTCTITHVSENGEWVQVDEEDRRLFLSLSEAAWDYTQSKLGKMEFNGDFKAPEFSAEGVELRCAIETYDGKAREKWDLANWGEREYVPVDDDLTRQLNARWKAKAPF